MENPHDTVRLTQKDIDVMRSFAPELSYGEGDETSRGIRDGIYASAEAAKRKAEAEMKTEATLEERVARLEKRKPQISEAQLDQICESVGTVIGEYVPRTFAELVQARCLMSFAGVWDSEREYRRGEVVTDSSSLWVAIDKVKGSRPGKSADFKLIAKAGST